MSFPCLCSSRFRSRIHSASASRSSTAHDPESSAQSSARFIMHMLSMSTVAGWYSAAQKRSGNGRRISEDLRRRSAEAELFQPGGKLLYGLWRQLLGIDGDTERGGNNRALPARHRVDGVRDCGVAQKVLQLRGRHVAEIKRGKAERDSRRQRTASSGVDEGDGA